MWDHFLRYRSGLNVKPDWCPSTKRSLPSETNATFSLLEELLVNDCSTKLVLANDTITVKDGSTALPLVNDTSHLPETKSGDRRSRHPHMSSATESPVTSSAYYEQDISGYPTPAPSESSPIASTTSEEHSLRRRGRTARERSEL